jgi:DedD protein
VLESRHLVGLFLGVVLLCCVFFTLGYVMGRTQYGLPLPLHASAATRDVVTMPPVKIAPGDPNPAPTNREWDFYSSDKNENRLEPAPPASAPNESSPAPSESPRASGAPRSAAPSKPANPTPSELRRFQPPRIPKGAYVLQLAALSKETDALALADALQQKHFPTFLVVPNGDNLYRVQVGPYAEQAAAERAKDSLDHAGFKAIIKR